eukprot:TRINITY_DN36623_c0_g1_i1.p1 TRINITY_DN36623_c0_g1~~TRINITY_DN36623_c0_g1_i1.p1  ORF type:complete len:358 (+),score=118.27 TRINITY_DN36623_c0_g1_i1:77-1075(+)
MQPLPAEPHPLDVGFFWMMVIGTFPGVAIAGNLATGSCLLTGATASRGWKMVRGIAALTIWQYWVYMFTWHLPRLAGSPGAGAFLLGLPGSAAAAASALAAPGAAQLRAHLLCYHVAMALWMAAWVRAMRTETRSGELTGELRAAQKRCDAAPPCSDERERALGDYRELKRRHRSCGHRSCDTMDGDVVPGFDHFCPFVNNAIGSSNRRFFLQALVWQLAAGGLLLWEAVPVTMRMMSLPEWGFAEAQIALGTLAACHVNILIAGLLAAQLAALALGLSTLELWSLLPWSRGDVERRPVRCCSLAALREALGSSVLLWLLPLGSSAPRQKRS